MEEFLIDCISVKSESDFWNTYLQSVKPQGAYLFGRNLDALWDALSGGGPGCPESTGKCSLRFLHSHKLKVIRDGNFFNSLVKIQADLETEGYNDISIAFE